jgi:hypothetical protein
MFNGQAPLAQRFSPLQQRSSRLHQFPPSRAASPSPDPRPGGVGRRPACGIERWPAAGAGRLGHALARRAAWRMRADPSTGWARWSVAKAVCIAYTSPGTTAENERKDALNACLTLAIERINWTFAHVEMTQVRMETLLAWMIPQGENGREV